MNDDVIIGQFFRLNSEYKIALTLRNQYDAIDGFATSLWTRRDKPEYYNAIPYGYAIPSKSHPDRFIIKEEYRTGTIDAYDYDTDAVGIYFGRNLVWFARESIWISGQWNIGLLQNELGV